jgi:hypothetical protein
LALRKFSILSWSEHPSTKSSALRRVIAISATRLVVLTKIADEFALHFNDETCKDGEVQTELIQANQLADYTSAVFFWTNIELSLAVVSSCLPTLRPIWTHLRPSKPVSVSGNTDYEMGNKRSKRFNFEQWTDIDDANAPVLGIGTSVRATETPFDEPGDVTGRLGTKSGPESGISVHTSVETRSVRNLL